MINHVRTLFLNENASDVAECGSFQVDPSFSRIRLGPALHALYDESMRGASDIASRANRAGILREAVGRVDLEPYMAVFDGRETPFRTQDDGFDLLGLFRRSGMDGTLFGTTGVNRIDSILPALRASYACRADGHMSAASAVLAYALQLEAARIRYGRQ